MNSNFLKNKNVLFGGGIFILCLVCILIGFFLYKYGEKLGLIVETHEVQVREDSSEYKYINPLLFLSNTEEKYAGLNPLKKMYEKYIDEKMEEGEVLNISVYFKKVNNGEWTGVREEEVYAPSSMLKIATLMAYLKDASEDPDLFAKKSYYKSKGGEGQYYKPIALGPGYYSDLVLLQQMIVQSDNDATEIIQEDHVEQILNLHKELKMVSPVDSPEDFMSPRTYSRFLRTLYNATYLSRTYSEQALKLLSLSSFEKGLKAGVPSDIVVAHKFGEHTSLKDGVLQNRELHDCGIIYSPKEPYLLCIMTKGKDFPVLEKVISDISRMTFEFENNNRDE